MKTKEVKDPIYPIGLTDLDNKPVYLKSQILDFLHKNWENNEIDDIYKQHWVDNNESVSFYFDFLVVKVTTNHDSNQTKND